MTPSWVRQQCWLSVRGAHAALLGLNKALPEIWRNPQKLTILLPKTERRLDGTGVIIIRWSDKGGEAYVPYVNAGRHHAYKKSGSRQQGKANPPRCSDSLSAHRLFPWDSFLHIRQWDQSPGFAGLCMLEKIARGYFSSAWKRCERSNFPDEKNFLLSLILLYGQIDYFYSEICCCPVNI